MQHISEKIKGFPDYKVTTDGRIWSDRRKIWLKPDKKKDGYLRVTLCKNGVTKRKYIHRLILETFVGSCPPDMECRHLDGNRGNNYINNLCWGTRKENSQDSIKHGTSVRGERNPGAKLTRNEVDFIKWVYSYGVFSTRRLAPFFKVSSSTIKSIVANRNWNYA